MRFVSLLLCVAAATIATSARAAIVAAEGFDSYAAGSQLESGADGVPGTGLNGGSGFTSAFDTEDVNKSHVVVASPGLSFSSGSVAVNGGANSVSFTGPITLSVDFVTRTLASQSDTLYLSFLLRGTQAAEDEDFLQFGFSSTTTGEPPIAMGIAGAVANTLPTQFFVRMPTLPANQMLLDSPNLAIDTTFLMVMKVSKVAGSANYNQLDFFLNPNSRTEPAAATLSRTADSGQSTLNTFRVRSARLDAGDSYFVDELKIGTTFSDVVVPEPSASLIGAVGAMLLASRGKRPSQS